MLRRILSGAYLVTTVGAAACAAPPSFTAADMQANQQLVDRWMGYFNAKQWDSLAQLYTEHASLMAPNLPAVRGREAIQQFMAGFQAVESFRVVDDTIDGAGGLAYARGRYWMTLAAAAGGASDSGKFVEVRRKQPDGSWRLEIDMFSSDVPQPPASAPPRVRK